MSARKDVQPVYDQNDLSIREILCSSALVPYLGSLVDIEHLSGINNGGIESVKKEFIFQVYCAFEMTNRDMFGRVRAIPFAGSLKKVTERYKQGMSHDAEEEQKVKQLVVQHFLEEIVEEVPFFAEKNAALRHCLTAVDDICIDFPSKRASRNYQALLKDNLSAWNLMHPRDDLSELKEDMSEYKTRTAVRAYEGEFAG